MNYLKVGLFIFILGIMSACNKKQIANIDEAALIHKNLGVLTKVIIYDGFTPPVAARIYGYTSLATYETIRFKDPKYLSITSQLKKFGNSAQPSKNKRYDFTLAATKAYFTVAKKLIFSIDTIKKYEYEVYAQYKDNLDRDVYERSINFGEQVAAYIIKRSKQDNYLSTRAAPKFLGSMDPGQWHPSPPDYMDGVEVYWDKLVTFSIDSSAQFPPPVPPPYSKSDKSLYIKQIKEVYQINKHLTPGQKEIAKFWDDNPFVIAHSGHMTYAQKKITPGGHWMGITTIACKQTNADAVKTAQAYAMASIAIYDAFICSWYQKYKYNYNRPVNEINWLIDSNWLPFLQTPPYPEYTAGHPTISRATSIILTHLFGDNFSYQDTSELKYIGLQRHFDSFLKASEETTISRVYGGIHYKNTVDISALQGKKIGDYIWGHIRLTR
ncbi:vanadium-dependent haloperoxidase [Mucilaginibacter sp. SP1R1]|uniref:vanadium-dependent haloperoxidase n=1 Tax=Mucilaginibacter sp. SP1R1 TaxID=2723091 RepID=UPI00161DCE26|nr:vanadium-dependent haloperoxidase [Mucilaginibacter sp. SP1R1]MBB6151517.1 hypothetical protein [Mucilaginibacter sp. SP1R1]